MMEAEYPYSFEFRVRLYRKEYPGKTFQRSLTVEGDHEHAARRVLLETAWEDGFYVKAFLKVERIEL